MSERERLSADKISQQEKLSLANRIMLDQNLSPATRLVGWYITDHINTKRGYAWPPQEMIAKALGVGERTVRRALKDLAPYFAIDRSRRQHEYRPQHRPNWPVIPAKMAAYSGQNGRPSFLDPTKHPINSAFANAQAASTDVDAVHKQLAIFERKLKKRRCSRGEKQAGLTLCKQVFEDRDPGDPAWERALRLLEEYGPI